jgi:epsilon-lactone hydrolase
MTSFQSYLIEWILRLRKVFVYPHSGILDIPKERAETIAVSAYFSHFRRVERLPVSANGVPAEWIVPAGARDGRSILYVHGGTFFAGSIESHRPLVTNIAIAARARALIIDYRLSPEHPFPAGLEDVITAYRWLRNTVASGQIAIASDSAGGALTLGMLIALRDSGEALPACAVCLSPATDLTLAGETWQTNRKNDIMLEYWKMVKGMEIYLRETDPRTPLASPYHADLKGLPPLLFQVGSAEMILSDSTRFAEKARAAGVNVTLEVWERMQHEWQFASMLLPEGKRAIAGIGKFIQQWIPLS